MAVASGRVRRDRVCDPNFPSTTLPGLASKSKRKGKGSRSPKGAFLHTHPCVVLLRAPSPAIPPTPARSHSLFHLGQQPFSAVLSDPEAAARALSSRGLQMKPYGIHCCCYCG